LAVVPVSGVTLPEAEVAMDAVLEGFLQDGVDADQLERIKMQVRAAQIYARDDVNGLANLYGSALASGLTIKDVQDWPAILSAVTPEDVMEAAHDVFQLKNSVTGYLTPPATDSSSTEAATPGQAIPDQATTDTETVQ